VTATIPKTMRAAVVDAPGPPEALRVADVPVPPLRRDHVIIALDLASVGSWDAKERSGEWRDIKPGTILGADGSGTVAAVGAGVRNVQTGDRVYSYSYDNADGGFYAEYVSVRAALVAHVPAQIRSDIAGAMPCVALTALSGLETLGVKRDDALLVFGASGGVGSFAVWLGSLMKAKVTGTARPDAHGYVLALGATHVIDPHARDLETEIRKAEPNGFDAALVTASGDTLPVFFEHLKPRAPVAYPDGVQPEPVAERHRMIAFNGEMSRKAFAHLNATIGTHTIPLEVSVFDLDDVVEAHRRIERGHVVGKLVLRIR
jgi:NADPH:quinone reductase-like Zn-dependent oxidoreductase